MIDEDLQSDIANKIAGEMLESIRELLNAEIKLHKEEIDKHDISNSGLLSVLTCKVHLNFIANLSILSDKSAKEVYDDINKTIVDNLDNIDIWTKETKDKTKDKAKEVLSSLGELLQKLKEVAQDCNCPKCRERKEAHDSLRGFQ